MRHKYLLLGQCSDRFEIYTYLTIEFVKRNFKKRGLFFVGLLFFSYLIVFQMIVLLYV
jgi:hypothetical protein